MNLSVKEVAKRLNVSDRTIQKRCKLYNLKKKGTQYIISSEVFNKWLSDHKTNETNDTETTINEYELIEYFTAEEHEVFKTRLIEYPHLKKEIDYLKSQIEYLRKSLDKHQEQTDILLNSINNSLVVMRERNALEFKDKI
jgi:transposase